MCVKALSSINPNDGTMYNRYLFKLQSVPEGAAPGRVLVDALFVLSGMQVRSLYSSCLYISGYGWVRRVVLYIYCVYLSTYAPGLHHSITSIYKQQPLQAWSQRTNDRSIPELYYGSVQLALYGAFALLLLSGWARPLGRVHRAVMCPRTGR